MATKGAKTKTGINRSILLRPVQDERLGKLLEATGLNRNAFFRLCVDKLTPKDVRELQGR